MNLIITTSTQQHDIYPRYTYIGTGTIAMNLNALISNMTVHVLFQEVADALYIQIAL